MSDVRVHRISAFPSGVWWVRWIDSVSTISVLPGTPTVKVVLGPVPPSPAGMVKLADVAKDASGYQVVEVAIGMIAGLMIGMIFEDGIWVSRLEAEERAFDFDLPGDWRGVFAANQEPSLISRPPWWTSPRYDVISASAYPRVIRPDSFCAVLQSQFDHGIVVIPASEVVRAFIAMHSDIAILAFSEPWDIGLAELVDVDASGVDEHGDWRVVARGKRLRKEWASSVASLMEAFNPAGAGAANMLHATAVAQGGRISAALPFDDCRLRFEARCLKLHPGKYLVIEVIQAQWPHRQGVTLVESGPLEELGQDAVQRSYPIDALALSYDRAEPIDVASDEAPAQMTETAVGAAGSVWRDIPVPDVVAGEARTRPERTPMPKPSTVASAASIGTPVSSAAVAQASITQEVRLAACPRFEDTAEILDDLVSSGGIRFWRTIAEPGRPRQLGSREVWAFEAPRRGQSRRWRYISRRRGVLRSAMLCEIALASGGLAYWIEIEPKSREAFKAFLFVADGGVPQAMRDMLRLVSGTEGVWRAPSTPGWPGNIRSSATWRHGRAGDARLSSGRALSALNALP